MSENPHSVRPIQPKATCLTAEAARSGGSSEYAQPAASKSANP